jgi:hypothetical protein
MTEPAGPAEPEPQHVNIQAEPVAADATAVPADDDGDGAAELGR